MIEMDYLRSDLKDLIPYKASNIEYDIILDSNESPFDIPDSTKERLIEYISIGNIFNRYPDPNSTALREAIAHYCGVKPNNILVAAGSDELIRMIINAFVDKYEYVLCPSPSFSMYNIYTKICGGIPLDIQLRKDYSYDMDKFISADRQYNAKVAFICNPNNPTGTVIEKQDIIYLIKNFDGLVVIDEAYFEFYGETMVDSVLDYENVIILRTFSKAFGAAGLRIGYLVANEDLVEDLYIIKSPYNVNTFSQLTALELLKNFDIIRERIDYIVSERDRLYHILNDVEGIEVVPSKANFLLLQLKDSQEIYAKLLEEGISVRNFPDDTDLSSCIRVSIGTRYENDRFLKVLLSKLERR
ncbi:MAG TPA: histidinol-phosphate transaminase [Clostridiales bacterium]|nr:histidinol-phosphate transaminase [Clostridiales bacterium]